MNGVKMGGYAMTSVFGTLVLVAMTGLTITNQQWKKATGEASSSAASASLDRNAFMADEAKARELEKALAKEDAALLASYERLQQHPRNVRQRLGDGPDPLANSVYTVGGEEGTSSREFVAAAAADDPNRRPRAVTRTTTTEEPLTTTSDEEERPFDFYDPSLTAEQKRGFVKKVV